MQKICEPGKHEMAWPGGTNIQPCPKLWPSHPDLVNFVVRALLFCYADKRRWAERNGDCRLLICEGKTRTSTIHNRH